MMKNTLLSSDFENGNNGSRKRRKRYTGNFKAKVVVEYIKGHKTLDEIADEHQVHPNQIKNWKTLLFKRAPEILDDRRTHEDPQAA